MTRVIHTVRRDGFTVKRETIWPGNDLFYIDVDVDVDEASIAIRARMRQRSVPHVKTPEEIDRAERWGSSRARKNDFVPTDILHLEIRAHEWSVLAIENTPLTPVEGKLIRAINRIQNETADTIHQ